MPHTRERACARALFARSVRSVRLVPRASFSAHAHARAHPSRSGGVGAPVSAACADGCTAAVRPSPFRARKQRRTQRPHCPWRGRARVCACACTRPCPGPPLLSSRNRETVPPPPPPHHLPLAARRAHLRSFSYGTANGRHIAATRGRVFPRRVRGRTTPRPIRRPPMDARAINIDRPRGGRVLCPVHSDGSTRATSPSRQAAQAETRHAIMQSCTITPLSQSHTHTHPTRAPAREPPKSSQSRSVGRRTQS